MDVETGLDVSQGSDNIRRLLLVFGKQLKNTRKRNIYLQTLWSKYKDELEELGLKEDLLERELGQHKDAFVEKINKVAEMNKVVMAQSLAVTEYLLTANVKKNNDSNAAPYLQNGLSRYSLAEVECNDYRKRKFGIYDTPQGRGAAPHAVHEKHRMAALWLAPCRMLARELESALCESPPRGQLPCRSRV